MRALDLRQKILFADTLNESKGTLVYETEHIQKLFLRTVETGPQDENVRVRVRSFRRDPSISDEELIMQVNNAVSTENERMKKLQSQNRPNDKAQNKILETLESLKAKIAQVKSQLKEQKETTTQTASLDYIC